MFLFPYLIRVPGTYAVRTIKLHAEMAAHPTGPGSGRPGKCKSQTSVGKDCINPHE